MLTSPDFRELLKIFEKHKIRYLVVGGYAVMKYSEPRFTKDLDLFIATDQKNATMRHASLVHPKGNTDRVVFKKSKVLLNDKMSRKVSRRVNKTTSCGQ